MSLEMSCTGCGRKLRAPETAAGKKIRCPNCQAIQELPGSDAPAGHVPAANVEMWQMKIPAGQTYGPVTKLELDSWVTEGRVTSDCHLLRVGSNEWQWAGVIYPAIAAPQAAAPAPATTAVAYSTAPVYAPSPYAPNPYAPNPYATPYAPQMSAYGLQSSKSKVVAALLAFLIPGLGIHRFYLGHIGIGVAIIVVSFATCGWGALWSWIEGFMLLFGGIDRDSDGRLLQ